MAFYHRLGKIPPKRHTTLYKDDGKSLYREELVSALGFSGVYSNKYHIHMPTQMKAWRELTPINLQNWDEAPLLYYHFFTDGKQSRGDFFSARNVFMHNENFTFATAHVTENADYFFRNAYAHEYIFVHFGSGELLSEYGRLRFIPGDQIIVPMGTTYQMNFDSFENSKIVVVESDTPYEIPRVFRNDYGQLLEDAPYCERDIKLPEYLEPADAVGDFPVRIKAGSRVFEYIYTHHPFDVVGWDGYLYPYAFNIKEFAPKVGQIHLPPPVHLAFTTQQFVVCNFCPRLFDFHPESIPAPYFHTNRDSAEVLYYVEGNFMSRKGIKEGSVTLHPLGIPHGPQPGKTEESIGKKDTYEYALMIDTFKPIQVTQNVRETMDPEYYKSWLE
mgnify:CR=1 FL=1